MIKRILLLALFSPFVFISCNNEEAELAAKMKQDSILAAQEDSLLGLFRGELEAIAGKINSVSANNGLITLDTAEGAELNKESIMGQVDALNTLIGSNQQQLNDLKKRMNSSKVKNQQLEDMIKSMEERLAQRESQIQELLKMLADKDVMIEQIIQRVDSMRVTNIELTQTIVGMDEEMHEVYYVVGEAKELKEKGIVTKEGGVLGLGGSKKMDVAQLDQGLYKKIDKRDLNDVPLFSKKARLISSHPEDSYTLKMGTDGQVEALVIKDKKRFWAATDYLIVEVSN